VAARLTVGAINCNGCGDRSEPSYAFFSDLTQFVELTSWTPKWVSESAIFGDGTPVGDS
jgi:hypothetical protein